MDAPPRIFSLGDNAVTIEFGNEISASLNRSAISLAEYVTANPFPGFVEAVPAYSSATIFYTVSEVVAANPMATSAFDTVRETLLAALGLMKEYAQASSRIVTIPVRFGPDESPDLQSVANFSGLPPEDVISIFLDTTYRVFMLGFLPGFAYMGTVDDRLAMPRHSEPRLKVPKGSVGIAGRQTGIYPSESPGGWQIIGRTDIELLTDDPSLPCVINPGDDVRFVRVSD